MTSVGPVGRTALYRPYDAGGTLLYVGIAYVPSVRFASHRLTKHWWPQVDRIDIEWYDTRGEAESAEADAIRTEVPIWNKAIPDEGRVFRTGVGRNRWAPDEEIGQQVDELVDLYREHVELKAAFRRELAGLAQPNGGPVPVTYLADLLGLERKSIYRQIVRDAR